MERIQKILAHAGFGSRRACEEYIEQGRVMVDGEVVRELGTKADPHKQDIRLDGRRIHLPDHVYWMLNKPKGVVSASSDDRGRPVAVDLIPEKRRIFCVGRLDEDSEGLLLLTNDGELTNLLTHPRYGVPRRYRVKVSGEVDMRAVQQLRDGVHLAEGRTEPAQVNIKRRGKNTSTLDITVRQGMNRQVRRMVAKVDLKVKQLLRIRLGPLRLEDLKPGEARRLTRSEAQRLRREAEKAAASAGVHTPVSPARRKKAQQQKRKGGPATAKRNKAGKKAKKKPGKKRK
jgi:23S rRNA pseudouridine2605 synthase